MFSHITVGSDDLARSRSFYDPVLATLGIPFLWDLPGECFAYGEKRRDEFVVTRPFDGRAAERGNGWHAAFLAPDRAAVDAFHKAALAHGGSDEGAPGLRPHYHAHYYAAYVRDPDGNKLQAVCHEPA